MCKSIHNLLFARLKYRHLFVLLLTLVLNSLAYAGELLSDNELAGVSAGAAGLVPDPTGDRPGVTDDLAIVGETSLDQWGSLQRIEDQSHANNTITTNQNMIVEAGSRADIRRSNQVYLSQTAQANLQALNVSNTSRSNLANAINLTTSPDSVSATQNNRVNQNEFQQASHATNTNTMLMNSAISRDETVSYVSDSVISSVYNDVYQHRVTTNSIVDIEIEPFTPEIVFDLLDIGTVIPEWSQRIISPAYINAIGVDPFGGEWGLAGGYSGLTLTGPTLAVNGLRPEGDDLYLEVEFNLPRLDMSRIYMRACASECENLSINLGSIGGNSVIPNNEIRLAGMNPLSDLELNVNTGIATAGRGNFSASDASVGISGELTTNISAFFDFSLDLSDHWWVDDLFGDNTNAWSTHAELDYEINIPFTVLDHQVDGFSADFEGSLCLKLFGGSESCGLLDYERSERLFSDNSVFLTGTEEYTTSNTVNQSSTYAEVHGGVLTGAEAELIVMTDSDLLIDSDSGVNIKDNAQQNLQALNVVNSAATISANSLNMNVAGRGQLSSPANSAVLLNQRNYFKQRL